MPKTIIIKKRKCGESSLLLDLERYEVVAVRALVGELLRVLPRYLATEADAHQRREEVVVAVATDAPCLVGVDLGDGADIVTFSTDKLLGGPQGGMVLGKKELIDKLRAHPLYRVLRVDKLALVALESVLKMYLDTEAFADEIPVWRMLRMSKETLEVRAKELAGKLTEACPSAKVEVMEDVSRTGGGAMPALEFPTYVAALSGLPCKPDEFAKRLRMRSVPVFARIKDDMILFDLRTIFEGDVTELVDTVKEVWGDYCE